MINLDHPVPSRTPNPPPWQVNYDNSGSKPRAFTNGLKRFSKRELSICDAPPNIATALLDRLAIWLVYEKHAITENDITFAGMLFELDDNGDFIDIIWNTPTN